MFGPMTAWMKLAQAQQAMAMSAAEVVWRRGGMMAQNAMTPIEATRMVIEKPAAFALGAQRAAMAAARGGDAAKVMTAGLRPIASAAAGNRRRLRR